MTSPTDIPKIPARFAHAAGDSAKGGRPGRASDTPAGAVVPFPKPHKINPWRGATPDDIAYARRQIDLCFDLFVSALHGHVENVGENLAFNLPSLDGVWAHLADARNELDAAFSATEDRAP